MSYASTVEDILDANASEFPRVLRKLESGSAEGDGESTRLLATVEAVGAGRPQSWERALDFLELAAEQGSSGAGQQLRTLAGGAPGEDWAGLRKAIDIGRLLQAPEYRSLSDDPRIRCVSSFATAEECDWLVRAARLRLGRAEIWDPSSGSGKVVDDRSNSAMEFRLFDLDVVTQVVRARIATVTKLPLPLFEVPQVLHYAVGQMFAPHYDFLDPSDPGNRDHLAARGQRIATFLLYLNDSFEGGETEFPLADVRYRGGTGDALFFANVDRGGNADPKTLHAGTPPTAGEKWVLSQWIRDRSPLPSA